MFRPPPTQLAPPGSPDRTVQDRARTMPLWQESSIACAGYVFHFFPYEAKLYFQDFVPDVPGFLDLLQDMSSFNPSRRISLTVALDRLKVLKSQTPSQVLSQVKETELYVYEIIPRSFFRTLFEVISTGRLMFACRFVWASFQKW